MEWVGINDFIAWYPIPSPKFVKNFPQWYGLLPFINVCTKLKGSQTKPRGIHISPMGLVAPSKRFKTALQENARFYCV